VPHRDGPLGSSGAAPDKIGLRTAIPVSQPQPGQKVESGQKAESGQGDDPATGRPSGTESRPKAADATPGAPTGEKGSAGRPEGAGWLTAGPGGPGAGVFFDDSAGRKPIEQASGAEPVPLWDPFADRYTTRKYGAGRSAVERLADEKAVRERAAEVTAKANRAARKKSKSTEKPATDPKDITGAGKPAADKATPTEAVTASAATVTEPGPDTKAAPVTPTDPATTADPATPAAPAATADPPTTADPEAEADPATTAAPEAEAEPEAEAGSKDSGGDPDRPGSGDETSITAAAATPAKNRAVRVLRRANPVRAAVVAGRSTSAWARRPSGRLILPAIIVVLVVGAAGTAGAYLVPKALQAAAAPSATPGFPLDDGGAGGPSLNPPTAAVSSAPTVPPGGGVTTAPTVAATGRPADSLDGWAQGVGTRVGIPVVAVEAYGYAELVVEKQMPNCHLSWTTLAAIGNVESDQGSTGGAVLGADGSVQPPIYGLPLDGKGGRQLVKDTDQGTLDGDSTYDRAVGPMQFIPSTWRRYGVDADNNGVVDPNDLDDAALTAGVYLCQGGRDLSKADSWWEAILSYNAIGTYAQKVFDTANLYGQRSRV
jgi:hypothetical protein